MNWFGPSGDCGCCDTYVCEEHTCTTRVEDGVTIRTHDGIDLETCECVDFYTGVTRLRDYTYVIHLTGTAGAASGTLGGTPYSLSGGDISGSYSFDVTHTDDVFFCSASHAPLEYILFTEKIGTFSGNDYWSVVVLSRHGLGNEIACAIILTAIGAPAPTTSGGVYSSRWDYDDTNVNPCSPSSCTCSYWSLINDGVESYRVETPAYPGVVGHDISDCTATSELV
jgi:hypothetical protein